MLPSVRQITQRSPRNQKLGADSLFSPLESEIAALLKENKILQSHLQSITVNACWFLTEIKALVHALATKGNEYYTNGDISCLCQTSRVVVCISFAYPVEKICGKMSPCSLKIQMQTTLPLSQTLDSTKVNLMRVSQNNVYLSYSTSTIKKKNTIPVLAYVVYCIHSLKCNAGVHHAIIVVKLWLISFQLLANSLYILVETTRPALTSIL